MLVGVSPSGPIPLHGGGLSAFALPEAGHGVSYEPFQGVEWTARKTRHLIPCYLKDYK